MIRSVLPILLLLSLLVTHVPAAPAVARFSGNDDDNRCPCADFQYERPELWKKAETARWMVHTIDYGVLTTISSRLPGSVPFGNVYSFIDGSCANATGVLYFYGTYMDASFRDMLHNPAASFTLTEASLVSSSCRSDRHIDQACSVTHRSAQVGDPENPVCARLTLSGTLVPVATSSTEFATTQATFFQRHPQMQNWPVDHEWAIVKLVVQDVWLIDYFGGAAILTPEQYYGAELSRLGRDENL